MSTSLSADQAHVFYGRISEFQIADCLTVLSNEEIERAERYLLSADKDRYIISKSILKRLIARFLKIETEKLRVNHTENGKPFLVDYPELQFNSSHSDDAFVIGFSWVKEIGVDIENLQRIPNISALERFLFTTAELQRVYELDKSQKQEVFIKSWTRKEALLKASGDGLTKAMNELEVSFIQDRQFSMEDRGNKIDWFLESFTLMNDYQGAVAVKGGIKEVCYTRFDEAVI